MAEAIRYYCGSLGLVSGQSVEFVMDIMPLA